MSGGGASSTTSVEDSVVAAQRAAAEHALIEPTPRPFPRAHGIDVESIKDHRERAKPAKGRLVLRSELLYEPEETAHSAVTERLGKHAPTPLARKLGGWRAWQGATVKRDHGENSAGPRSLNNATYAM